MYLSIETWKKYRNFTINKLKNATVDWNPYWHVVIEETLHPELLHLCSTEWPDLKTVTVGTRSQPQGFNQNRSIFIPEAGDIPFWNEYYNNIMCHVNVQKTIYAFNELKYENERWVTSSLWEDYRGYSVNNHYDGHTIDVAWQIYLSCDGGKHLGTCLNDKDGNILKEIPNIPNLSWIMRVDSYSWHSCKPIKCNNRRSIMTRFMYKFAHQIVGVST